MSKDVKSLELAAHSLREAADIIERATAHVGCVDPEDLESGETTLSASVARLRKRHSSPWLGGSWRQSDRPGGKGRRFGRSSNCSTAKKLCRPLRYGRF